MRTLLAILLLAGIAEAQDYVQSAITLYRQAALLLQDASEYYLATQGPKDPREMKEWPTLLGESELLADKLARNYQEQQELGTPVSFQEWESQQRTVCDEFFLPASRTALDMMNKFASIQAALDSHRISVFHNKRHELVVFTRPLLQQPENVLARRYWTDLHRLADIGGCDLPSWYEKQIGQKTESLDDFLAAKRLSLTGGTDAWGNPIVVPSDSAASSKSKPTP